MPFRRARGWRLGPHHYDPGVGDLGARYDAIADFYDGSVADEVADVGSAALLDLTGDVGGQRVADIACGQGRMSRALARRGAEVVGFDLSDALLAKARAAERLDRLGVSYVLADVTTPDALVGEAFDAVVCNYGLSDIDNLDGALATVSRVLEPGGWFVFSILHPCFPGWDDDAPSSWPADGGYYQEGWWLAQNTGFRGKVGANHRTLSTYLNRLTHHHLQLDVVVEPAPGATWAARKPGAAAVPVHLVARCRQAATVDERSPSH
jgi:ubiquinone/menaquinone biosynthesis C-methylase UbiE